MNILSNRLFPLIVLLLFIAVVFLLLTTDKASPPYVELSHHEVMSVQNDMLRVDMYVQVREADASKVEQQVNQQMQKALAALSAEQREWTQTQRYHVYFDAERDEWVGRQTLRLDIPLETHNAAELLQNLQPYLTYQSMQAYLSHDAQQAQQHELLTRALREFEHKAELVAEHLGYKGYKLVHLDTDAAQAPVMMRAMSMRSADSLTAPAIEAGQQQIALTLQGKIQPK